MENMENNVLDENVQPTENVEETPVAEEIVATEEAPAEEAAPAAEETPKTPEAIIKNIWAKVKALPKVIWIAAAAVVVVIIAAVILFNVLTNTYKTPVSIMEDVANTQKITDYGKYLSQQLNGFAEDEYNAIMKILMKSDDVKDSFDDMLDNFNDSVEDKKDEYGDDYKYTYEIIEKEEMEKEDRREMRDDIKDLADDVDELIDETKDYDSDDWEDMADESGLTKAQCKDLVKAFEALKKALKNPEVDEGYVLTVKVTLTGSELDEPEEEEIEVYVYKINGRWVSKNALNVLVLLGWI